MDVRSEITGNVWQVHVEVGATVAAGDILLVMESMKMEISVEAPVAGVVAEVRVPARGRRGSRHRARGARAVVNPSCTTTNVRRTMGA
jgi:predicted deacylase